MGQLTQMRKDLEETLNLEGIKTVSYDTKDVLPPVAIVVPDDPYIIPPARNQRMKQWNVSLTILLIASRGSETENADELDDLIEKTYKVLSSYPDSIDINGVSAPAQIKIKGNNHFASVVNIEYQKVILD